REVPCYHHRLDGARWRRSELFAQKFDFQSGEAIVGHPVPCSPLNRKQLLWLGVGKRAQKDAVDYAENRRICANAESKCEDGYRREPRLSSQNANSVAKVLEKSFHWSTPRCFRFRRERRTNVS